MLGTIVNVAAIIFGSLAGLIFRRGSISEKYSKSIMHAISLSVILIGLKGALKSDEILLIIFSLAIGTLIGEYLKIEDYLLKMGLWLEMRFSKTGDTGQGSIAKGFVTASLVYCVGAMAIVGSLESGLSGNHQTLFAKSVLDGITAVIFTASLGIGVMLSFISVFLYQGIITLTASFMKHFLVPEVIAQMSAVGGLLITAIGFNLLEIKNIKVGNMLPAIFLPLIYFMAKQIYFLFWLK